MLTGTLIDHIRYNQSFKYHKIVFGNGMGKYSLDEYSFPDELSLNESEFWQADRTWLLIIDMISDLRVAAGWKVHHSRMITDTSFVLGFRPGANMTGFSGHSFSSPHLLHCQTLWSTTLSSNDAGMTRHTEKLQ